MSGQPGLSRRALLGLFRAPAPSGTPESVTATSAAASVAPRAPVAAAEPRESVTPRAPSPAPAFSLESFYAARAESGHASTDGRIPIFSLREGLPVPQQTSTGMHPEAASAQGTPEQGDEPAQAAPVPSPTVRQEARPAPPRLGATVRVRTGFCLAWQGSFCSTCVERCPIPGAIVMEAGRPRVVAERCDGCGTCVRVCPAPFNAFELRPAGAPGATP